MSGEQRLSVAFGGFKCDVIGYDEPVSILNKVITLVQEAVDAAPQIGDATALSDLDHARISARLAEDAIRLEAEQSAEGLRYVVTQDAAAPALDAEISAQSPEQRRLRADSSVATVSDDAWGELAAPAAEAPEAAPAHDEPARPARRPLNLAFAAPEPGPEPEPEVAAKVEPAPQTTEKPVQKIVVRSGPKQSAASAPPAQESALRPAAPPEIQPAPHAEAAVSAEAPQSPEPEAAQTRHDPDALTAALAKIGAGPAPAAPKEEDAAPRRRRITMTRLPLRREASEADNTPAPQRVEPPMASPPAAEAVAPAPEPEPTPEIETEIETEIAPAILELAEPRAPVQPAETVDPASEETLAEEALAVKPSTAEAEGNFLFDEEPPARAEAPQDEDDIARILGLRPSREAAAENEPEEEAKTAPPRRRFGDFLRRRKAEAPEPEAPAPEPAKPAFGRMLASIDAPEEPELPDEPTSRPIHMREVQKLTDEMLDGELSPADFAQRVGAISLQELLEASAVYMAMVEGRSKFSRRDVMLALNQIGSERDYPQQARLKSFRKLLTTGALVRVDDGMFAVSETIRDGYEMQLRA